MFGFIVNKLSSYFPTSTINWEILLSTSLFFIFGLCYYIFKLSIQSEVLSNRASVNSISNHSFDNVPLNNEFTIHVQIREERKRFTVNKNNLIRNFIDEKIKPLIDNLEADLIFQGRRLDKSKTFDYYSGRLVDGSVIICAIRQGNGENENNSEFLLNYNENENNPNSVSVFAILVHLIILSIAIFFILCYKKYNELFTPETVNVIQFMLICWAFVLSGTITKLFYYKTIVI